MSPASSGNTRSSAVRRASQAASASADAWPTPTSANSPSPARPDHRAVDLDRGPLHPLEHHLHERRSLRA